ncbi:ABC transporter permease [Planosporangium sp. 12N6]|uniref:ABC transporter permease n=1 Tax=Planosporangium spinosum TaxID=3402278 RepID=UPI003CF7700E
MTSEVRTAANNWAVLRLLVQRDLAVKYQQSFLGYLWSMLEPLALGIIYWFVFGVLYGTRVGPDGGSYALFLVTGLFPWLWINSSLSESTGALTSQARLITTMKVRRELFPLGRVMGRFAEYIAGLPVLLLFAVVFHADFSLALVALPLALILQAAFLIGCGLLLAPLNVLLRDVQQAIRIVQRVLFYAAPVLYPLQKLTHSHAPQWVKDLYQCNPLVGVFQLHHAVFFPAEFPSVTLLGISALGCFGTLALGWWTFSRLESAVLKEL